VATGHWPCMAAKVIAWYSIDSSELRCLHVNFTGLNLLCTGKSGSRAGLCIKTASVAMCVASPTFLSWRTDKTNSCSSAVLAGADTPSMSVSAVKSHLFVMVSESGCWVVMQLDVMHKTRRYFPRHDALVHKYRATQSGGVCPSAACRK